MDDSKAVDVIYLNLSNFFTIFTTEFSLENQEVMVWISVLSAGMKTV